MTQRIWARIFSKMTRRIELLLQEWVKEMNLVSKEESQRVQLFFDSEVKNCFLSFATWLEELNFFFNMSQWIEPFSWTWPTELNFFQYDWKNSELFKKIWLTELNTVCKKKDSKNVLKKSQKMTQRLEPFSNTTHRIELFSNTTQRIEPSFRNMTQRTQPFF